MVIFRIVLSNNINMDIVMEIDKIWMLLFLVYSDFIFNFFINDIEYIGFMIMYNIDYISKKIFYVIYVN